MMNKTNKDLQRIYKTVHSDPTIRDPSKIMFSVDKKGPVLKKRKVLVAEGRVGDVNEYQKVEHIIENMNLEYEMINNLKISAPKL